MVIAANCPVHGPFESHGIHVENSTNVSFSGNVDSCPVPGCGLPARVMDGTFSFTGGQTIVHEAPEWSIRALNAVETAIQDALRLAADPETSDPEVRVAFDKAAALARVNSRDAPVDIRNVILDLLSLAPLRKVKGFKRKSLAALAILHLVLTNYSTYKASAIEISSDVSHAIEVIVENSCDFASDVQVHLGAILDDLNKK
ncbi:hypothetical protein [Glutamicibacter sp. NPDC090743]|uniref:hypothetical protein n=1 Tax=Glutamicibacter sp. NPDC090743 TaxID=3364001 RepID=UPI00382BE486